MYRAWQEDGYFYYRTREGMNIGAVARATGFRSEVSMKRAFMRSIEMTPSEYQSRYLKREPV